MSKKYKVGDTIKAGELLLFTSGTYSDFYVNGLYRAKVDFVMPTAPGGWAGTAAPDIYKVSADPSLVEELDYTQVWRDS
jgi:hypothetical protein